MRREPDGRQRRGVLLVQSDGGNFGEVGQLGHEPPVARADNPRAIKQRCHPLPPHASLAFHSRGSATFVKKGLIGWGARIRTWDHGTKTRCLTAWPRPNRRPVACGLSSGRYLREKRARKQPERRVVSQFEISAAFFCRGCAGRAWALRPRPSQQCPSSTKA